MWRLPAWVSRLPFAWARRRFDAETRREIDAHIELLTHRYLQQGMTADEALTAARRQFGNATTAREEVYAMNSLTWLEGVAQDLRYAVRQLRHNPAFAATAIATLALAIGAHTAMFSVLNTVLLRPLPYPSPEQLVMVWLEDPSQGLRERRSAYLTVAEWQRHSRSFVDLAVFDEASATLRGADGTDRISVVRASPSLFGVLGVQPSLGRTYSVEEADAQRRVAVISHRFWQTRFAGAPDTIGAFIDIDGRPSQIVGILSPEGFRLDAMDANVDVWEPHTMIPDWTTARSARGEGPWFVLGRLHPHVTVDQARTEMNAIARRLDEQLPAAARNRSVAVVPMSQYVVGSRPRLALWLLTGAVSCVLLIAAANVASLSLARAVGRRREMAIRSALGATSRRIARQLIAENVTIAVLAGLLGTGLALVGIRVVQAFGPGNLSRLPEAGLDTHVLTWAVVLSCLTGLLVGLMPAITVMRRGVRPSGEDGGRSVAGGVATRRIRRALVVAEFSLAIVLLVGAGLLARSWWNVERVDLGFQSDRVLSMQLSTTAFADPAQRTDFYERALDQIEALPGVDRAGIMSDLFISSQVNQIVTTDGDTGQAPERLQYRSDEASDGAFSVIGTPLLRGRLFSAEDGRGGPPVAIVNDAMARRLWPDADPVGRRFKFGPADSNAPWFAVVGVVGDMRREGLEREPIPQMFEPLAQNPSRLATLLVRTSGGDPLRVAEAVRAIVHRVDPRVPVYGATTLDQRIGGFLSQRRFQTSLLIGFAVLALLLAAIGIYGLIRYSVATRTHEIAIRMAIGAQAGDIFRLIVREGLTLTAIGLAIGLLAAVLVGRAGSSLLFSVTATDPATFVAVSVLLAVVAAAACYFPARRAMKVEPVAALRQG
jgi:putative ABC transport system permease protein